MHSLCGMDRHVTYTQGPNHNHHNHNNHHHLTATATATAAAANPQPQPPPPPPQPPPPQTGVSLKRDLSSVPLLCKPLRVMSDVARTGAAKRRRERRLHSWPRHERMSTVMAGQVKHVGLRAEKTDSSADGEEVVQDAHASPH